MQFGQGLHSYTYVYRDYSTYLSHADVDVGFLWPSAAQFLQLQQGFLQQSTVASREVLQCIHVYTTGSGILAALIP